MTTTHSGMEAVQRPAPLLRASLPELVGALSVGIDAAEGRDLGHGRRVGFLATLLASELELDREQQRAVLYAALLHDIGTANAAGALETAPQVDAESLFTFAPTTGEDPPDIPVRHRPEARLLLRAHTQGHADFLSQPWFPATVPPAVRSHHENWDGSGYPHALQGEEIPLLGRLVRAADLFESVVASETNPLAIRVHARGTIRAWAGRELQPEICGALEQVIDQDAFWLDFAGESRADGALSPALADGAGTDDGLLEAFSRAVAQIADVKAEHERGRAERVAVLAEETARALGLAAERAQLLGIAALWNDMGALGVPSRILAKPDLLTLEEMERLHVHPRLSGEILRRIPALAEAAPWVAAHHERPDGNGYPRMLSGPEVSSEAGILSLADAFVAMRSKRPYRPPLSEQEALRIIRAGAGTRWDPFLVRTFVDVAGAGSLRASA